MKKIILLFVMLFGLGFFTVNASDVTTVNQPALLDFEDSGEPEYILLLDFEDSGEPEYILLLDFEDSGEPEYILLLDFEDSGEPEYILLLRSKVPFGLDRFQDFEDSGEPEFFSSMIM